MPATVSERPPRELPPLPLRLPGGAEVLLAVRESARARRARLTASAAGAVTLVVPRGTSRREAGRLAASRADWVERQLRRAAARALRPAVLRPAPGLVPLAGGALAVQVRPGPVPVARRQGLRLVVEGPAATAEAAIERWYRREAAELLQRSVERLAPRVGAAPRRIAVRDQRTRWGSCSRSGTLSFSWRLALAPPAVLDYVVVHELCHLHEPSHRPRFWQLVAAHCPDHAEHVRWLREHGPELGAFSPASCLP